MITNDYHKQYNREYRAEGFAKISDRRYYEKNKERRRTQMRWYMRIKRAKSKGLLLP